MAVSKVMNSAELTELLYAIFTAFGAVLKELYSGDCFSVYVE